MTEMFQYLFYTILLEMPVVILIYRKDWRTVIPVEILLNCFTWPVLSILYYEFPSALLLLEAGVFVTEAVALKLFFDGTLLRALIASLVANATSLLVGVWVSGISLF